MRRKQQGAVKPIFVRTHIHTNIHNALEKSSETADDAMYTSFNTEK